MGGQRQSGQKEIKTVPTVKEDIAVLKEQVKALPRIEEKIDTMSDKLDRKFASKWVEWFNKTLIGAVVLGGCTALASVVVKALGSN